MDPKPSIGLIVRYQAFGTPGGEHPSVARAAIITAVEVRGSSSGVEHQVSLCVLNPTGMFFNLNVPYSATPKPGHWSWPPRT